MKVDVRSLGFTMTEAMRAKVMEGLGRALRRRRQAVRRVEVRLSDVNGRAAASTSAARCVCGCMAAALSP